jgi:hypothetical protein
LVLQFSEVFEYRAVVIFAQTPACSSHLGKFSLGDEVYRTARGRRPTEPTKGGIEKLLKLFEALALKKVLQNQLTQLISIRNSTFEYPEDEKPEFDFQELTSRIKEKVNEITGLKLAVMNANMNRAQRLPPLRVWPRVFC